ncbi:MAG: C69 family dipeptidase, partial [Duodenibacillus sp.]|nr:C69 family dipeptidase [Duodenibacillus sp.]
MCTTVLAGCGATADGSLIVARSADNSAMKAQRLLYHPAAKRQKGRYSSAARGGCNNFTWPLPRDAFAFTTAPFWKTGLHGATGFNSQGVGLSGTETLFARDEALAHDPYVAGTGVTEDDIPDVILPEATSARHGAQLLGAIIESAGCGEGFGVAFVDAREIWWLETGSGHQWMAARLPSDRAFAAANQGRLQAYDPVDLENYMASPGLVSYAIEHGLWNPEAQPAFNFALAYHRNDERDAAFNTPRVHAILERLLPGFSLDLSATWDFPVFARPASPVTVAGVKAMLRDHYQCSRLAAHDPYADPAPDEPLRPVSVFRTYESHIMQVRPRLPKAIGCVTYIAFGMADLSCYVPFYQGVKDFPAAVQAGTDEADDKSAYWAFRKVQTLAMTDYPRLAPVVQAAYAGFESRCEVKMAAIEKRYLKLLKGA